MIIKDMDIIEFVKHVIGIIFEKNIQMTEHQKLVILLALLRNNLNISYNTQCIGCSPIG